MNMNGSDETWPRRDRSTARGYVYVVRYSTGAVKVGQTRDPHDRLRKLSSGAAQFGVTVADAWLSPMHGEHEANERELIRAGCRMSERLAAETFAGSFDELVTHARTLPMTDDEVPTVRGLTPAEQRTAARRQHARTMRANGATFRAIAQTLGVSLGQVHADCRP